MNKKSKNFSKTAKPLIKLAKNQQIFTERSRIAMRFEKINQSVDRPMKE